MFAPPGVPVTDTGARLSTEGHFVLLSNGGTEMLGLTCPRCGELSVKIQPLARCQRCRAYLFMATSPTQAPKEYRVNFVTATVTTEEEATWPEPSPSVAIVEPEVWDPEIILVSSTLTLPLATSPPR